MLGNDQATGGSVSLTGYEQHNTCLQFVLNTSRFMTSVHLQLTFNHCECVPYTNP